MANVIFKVGTKPLYTALEQKDANTLYWLTDVQEVYKGDVLFGTGKLATETEAGLMSPEDKAKIANLSAGTVLDLTPVDASVVIAGGESGKTIGVQLSQEAGNLIQVKGDGLFVAVDEQTVEQAAAEAATAAVNEFATQISDDGTVNTFKELVDYVAQHGPEAADMAADIAALQETVGAIDLSKYVLETIDATNGKAIIQNEPTGGGPKFHHNDGSQAFVGVNDGGLDGMMAQIYADKQVDGSWVGSRINVYHDHIYYTNLAAKEAGKANNAAECEIATVGDVAAVQAMIEGMSQGMVWQDM